MNKIQQQVQEFHEKFGIPVGDFPRPLNMQRTLLRLDLIQEEYAELCRALLRDDMVGTVDALGDLLYVIYGCAVELGVDMESISDEIHRSNMTKVGGHFDERGKLIKPPTYSQPDLEKFLNLQKEDKNA